MASGKKLHSITALFKSPDEIINAAKKTTSAGYKKFDVNTPYPVHGMDGAMGLGQSKIGFVTLFFGLTGAAFIFLFMWWSFAASYNIVVGGKPFLAAPAFIPITFETTVLFAAISTVVGMIAVYFKLPDNSHPLHDTEYMKAVSGDKFGLVIEAEDSQFVKVKVSEFLNGLGAYKIEEVYYPEKEKFRMFSPKFLLFLGIVVIATCGTTYVTLNKAMYVTPFDWMDYQDKLVAQEKSNIWANDEGMRPPVEGTVARSDMPYPYMGQTTPTNVLVNPTFPNKEILALGKKKFLTFCSPCHGNLGDGNSRLNGQFPNGPTLHSDKIINYSDGMIYHIMTNGQNAMPSYARQVTRKERWAIVDYIRVLQRAQNAKESDLQAVNKESVSNVQN
ncbi:MAG TPA: quinol:electron acceptor oxidoreductase subunit ActD [Ignavibacteriaceae bacterium]|nr:quinol:electron acceptor oxidoreductase subunit ActD [Ignavibacteriaceae bacterium]